jgi:hypothetical protein
VSSDTPIKLRIPRQDLQAFAHFEPDGDAALTWSQGLPITDTRSVVHQLIHAVGDLNRLKLAPEVRFQIMEALRPNLQVTLSNLSRRFVNQPLIMPEEPRQMAELSDQLHSLASTAFTIVAIEVLQHRDAVREMNPARLVCAAIQRALDFAGRKLLQTFQLYRQVEYGGWLALHQLYALAEHQRLATLPVEDRPGSETTITATYLQALIMGCCKPNQLRHSDLGAIYRGLQDWSPFIRLSPPESGSGLFLVDLDSDQPPLYSSLYEKRPGAHCRYLDTAPLIAHLQKLQAEDDRHGKQGVVFDKDTRLPSNILTHLITALGSMSLRNFARTASDNRLAVCIGLSAAHYHVAGERSFQQLLFGDDYLPPPADRVPGNPFIHPEEKDDAWEEANPEEDYLVQEISPSAEIARFEHQIALDKATLAAIEGEDLALTPEQRYPIHQVRMVNASPGGYCLEWTTDLPGEIRTGDIVSVREQRDRDWAIAVIRWVSNLEDSRTLVGLELLSPRAMPFGARIQKKTGEQTVPMRVLLLPEIKLVGQAHTLITPRAAFRERQKITLMSAGEEFYVQLLHQVAATGSFSQFDFQYIKRLGEVIAEDKSSHVDSSFDSVWSKI